MQGIAARVLKTVFPATAALALLLTACDFSGGSSAETETGLTLHISIVEAEMETVDTPLDTKVARYIVAGTGPEGATFLVETQETTVVVADLASGEWNIAVDAMDESGNCIKKGKMTTPLDPGAPRAVTVTIQSLSVDGSIDVILAWDPNMESDLAGYKLYCGTESGVHDLLADVGKDVTTYTVQGLDPDLTYYFTATAYNTNGQESDFATEIVF